MIINMKIIVYTNTNTTNDNHTTNDETDNTNVIHLLIMA